MTTPPVYSGVSLWDVEDAPASIISLATVRALSEELGEYLDPLRFRANVYVDGLPPWEEFGWNGRLLRVGGAKLAVLAVIERCRATSARPGGGVWDLNIPGALAAHFGHPFLGVYARVRRPGTVSTGDRVAVRPAPTLTAADGLFTEPAAPRWGEVVEAERPAPGITSLYLRDPHGFLGTGAASRHVRVHSADDRPGWRNYTLSGTADGLSRITVREVPGGTFSPWLARFTPGDPMLLSGPYGDAFLPEQPSEVVLVTAGIGITPALALIQALAERGRSTPCDRPSRRPPRGGHPALERDLPGG